jgi:hypothetical protein
MGDNLNSCFVMGVRRKVTRPSVLILMQDG